MAHIVDFSDTAAARLKFYINYADAPRVDEAADVLAAVDAAFRAFANENGAPGAFLTVARVEEGSLSGILKVAGWALGGAALAIEQQELLRAFLMHAHIGVQLTLDTGVIDPVRNMLAVIAAPVAGGRASNATLGDAQSNDPEVLIDRTNARSVVARRPTDGVNRDDHKEAIPVPPESVRLSPSDAAIRTRPLVPRILSPEARFDLEQVLAKHGVRHVMISTTPEIEPHDFGRQLMNQLKEAGIGVAMSFDKMAPGDEGVIIRATDRELREAVAAVFEADEIATRLRSDVGGFALFIGRAV